MILFWPLNMTWLNSVNSLLKIYLKSLLIEYSDNYGNSNHNTHEDNFILQVVKVFIK